jgi:Zn-dependent protease
VQLVARQPLELVILVRVQAPEPIFPAVETMKTPDLALGVIWYIVFLFSTTCHEASHALAAKMGGDLTAFEGGQVTLNPIPHIRRSTLGMVVVPIVSYLLRGWMMGWASAPFDPNWQRRYPRRSAWMALAGPAANFALMLLAGITIRVGVAFGYFRALEFLPYRYADVAVSAHSSDPTFAATCLSILFVLNLLLGTFNLLPVPPLDGHAVIMLFMGEDVARRYLDWVQGSGYTMLGLIVAWYAFSRIFGVIFSVALGLLYPGIQYG